MFKFPLILFLFPLTLWATEYQPWYPRDVELQTKTTLLYQNYQRVQSYKSPTKHSSNDLFLLLSGGLYYAEYGIELETALGHTRHQKSIYCDSISLTGRYQLMDDVIGDPMSVTVGLTARQVFKLARHDVSCFYHGGIEGEVHIAAGFETSCHEFWSSHLWGMGAFGMADLGLPWIRLQAAWDANLWDLHEMGIFINTLWGMGHHSLRLHHFRGYGPIRHDSVDVGFRMKYAMEWGGILGAGYAHRVFAQNCPENVNLLFISLDYPIGLGL